MATKLLAASPFVNPGDGMQHTRVVLKIEYYGTDNAKYVIHKQYVSKEGAKSSYAYGSYPTTLERAWEVFKERSQELMDKVFSLECPETLSDLNAPEFKDFYLEQPGVQLLLLTLFDC